MNPYLLNQYLAYLFVGIMLTSISPNLLASAEQALAFYKDHEFDQAIDACEDKKDNFSRMVAAVSYAERFGIYKNSADKAQKKAYMNILEEIISLEDLADIERVIAVQGNPFGQKEAEKLLKRAFANLRTTEDVLIALEFLNAERNPDHNKTAMNAILKFLKRIRTYVSKGGTMPSAEKKLFTNQRLIESLVNLLDIKESSRLAKNCLVLIEEPALEFLEEKPLTPSISDAIVAVRKAMGKRLKKFPRSTWSSAAG